MTQINQLRKSLTQPGILAALGAALLFGSSTPLAKLLLAGVSPWLMAALLYLGSGIGLSLYACSDENLQFVPLAKSGHG
jgi:drug/metabolite transporter (DMT)-like permease